MSTTYTARWIFPAAGREPLEQGTLTVESNTIAAVEPAGRYTPDIDFGNAAILPGLGNAHTHLDLSGAHNRIHLDRSTPAPERATAWLEQVIAFRKERSKAETLADIQTGLKQALRYGTTLLGDISSGGLSFAELQEAPVRSVCYYEVLGFTTQRITEARSQFLDWFYQPSPRQKTSHTRKGLSPHAPYSTARTLYQLAQQIPELTDFATHLAEFPVEQEFLANNSGPFAAFLDRLGIHTRTDRLSSAEEALVLTQIPTLRRVIVHGNDLEPKAAAQFLPSDQLVFCPRTHAAFGHAPHPASQFAQAGVRICLGTDSLASNPDLDPLAEARFLFRTQPDLSPAWLLETITTHAAAALGWQAVAGCLTPQRQADFVVVPLPGLSGTPYELLLGSNDPSPRRTYFAGQERISLT